MCSRSLASDGLALTRRAPRLERSGSPAEDQPQTQQFLLCLTVGIQMKETVARIVTRFDLQTFAVVLFHYDGNVEAWSDQPWHDVVVHVRLRRLS